MGRRVLLALVSTAVLVGLVAQPGAAVNVPQAVVVSGNPADWTHPGADAFVASGAIDGRNWSGVNGMTMASGRLLYATTTGTLSAVDFSGGLPTGGATVLSGPAIDGQTWQSRSLLVLNLPT